ncbi:hypothetical protein T459_34327 [Capsicum annuum]|uniref:WW domain-containing protein n=1 Tax=Capsicum annuum TaxID=4072 RepID=A0A2G2XX11_CAPAN|nr:hypothetical protein T459_34327 [Capsicum annuum]
MQKTGELAAPLVVPEVNYVFDPVVTIQSDWIEHTSRKGKKYYYNKVTRTSKWRMPDEVKLAHEKDIISHASDFGSIPVVKTSSPGADGSLVSAHGAKSSPIAVSPAANLPTILASESSSLSGKVSLMMIETVQMKNSSEPSSPAVANSDKIGIAVTLGNSVPPPVSETTSAQDAVVYGDGFSPENREDVKKDAAITEIGGATPPDEKTVELGPLVCESKGEAKNAFKTLLESANIGSDCTWDQAMRAVINDWIYGALKSLGERKQAFNEVSLYGALKSLGERKQAFNEANNLYGYSDFANGYECNPKSSMPQILNDDDILDSNIVFCVSTDILNADDILDASVVSSASTDIE